MLTTVKGTQNEGKGDSDVDWCLIEMQTQFQCTVYEKELKRERIKDVTFGSKSQ